jgi:DNA-binding NarL/FixJ family response regulator
MAGKTIKTMIVDDSPGFRRHLREYLRAFAEIEVVGEAADGQEALLKAREIKPDLVLMDLRMPKVDGIEATRRLRQELPELAIIFLSNFDMPAYRKAAADSGANGYVAKDSLVEELLKTIREVCG